MLGTTRIRSYILILAVIGLIIILLPEEFYAQFFIRISNSFDPSSELSYKFNDISRFISPPNPNEINMETAVGIRVARFPLLFKAFIYLYKNIKSLYRYKLLILKMSSFSNKGLLLHLYGALHITLTIFFWNTKILCIYSYLVNYERKR